MQIKKAELKSVVHQGYFIDSTHNMIILNIIGVQLNTWNVFITLD